MITLNKNSILMYNEKLLNELYNANALLNAIICCCQEKEFMGEYYGIPKKFVHKISNERNEYLSLLALLTDKINYINKLCSCIEQEITLH